MKWQTAEQRIEKIFQVLISELSLISEHGDNMI